MVERALARSRIPRVLLARSSLSYFESGGTQSSSCSVPVPQVNQWNTTVVPYRAGRDKNKVRGRGRTNFLLPFFHRLCASALSLVLIFNRVSLFSRLWIFQFHFIIITQPVVNRDPVSEATWNLAWNMERGGTVVNYKTECKFLYLGSQLRESENRY